MNACVDACVTYAFSIGGTVTPDLRAVISAHIAATLKEEGLKAGRLGWQSEFQPRLIGLSVEEGLGEVPEWVAVDAVLAAMQEVKDPDEIELIRKAVQADLAAYAAAEEAIAPGVS